MLEEEEAEVGKKALTLDNLLLSPSIFFLPITPFKNRHCSPPSPRILISSVYLHVCVFCVVLMCVCVLTDTVICMHCHLPPQFQNHQRDGSLSDAERD